MNIKVWSKSKNINWISERDQDLSPKNDPDWEGANRDTQDAKEETEKKIEEKKNVLSEAILTDTSNVISEL